MRRAKENRQNEIHSENSEKRGCQQRRKTNDMILFRKILLSELAFDLFVHKNLSKNQLLCRRKNMKIFKH